MVHFYTWRHVPRWPDHASVTNPIVYKRFCDKARVTDQNDKNFTSVAHKVTCAACLELLLPKKQLELDTMKAALERARSEVQCTTSSP